MKVLNAENKGRMVIEAVGIINNHVRGRSNTSKTTILSYLEGSDNPHLTQRYKSSSREF